MTTKQLIKGWILKQAQGMSAPGGEPPAATPEPGQPAAAHPPAAETGKTEFSADYVKSLREENASWRTKLREAENRTKQIEEQLAAAAAQTAKLERSAATRLNVVMAAAGAGFNDPGDVLKFIKLDELEAHDDEAKRGDAINNALEALKNNKPYLLRQVPAGQQPPATAQKQPSAGNPTGQPTFTADQIAAMSAAEINQHWDVIKHLLPTLRKNT